MNYYDIIGYCRMTNACITITHSKFREVKSLYRFHFFNAKRILVKVQTTKLLQQNTDAIVDTGF